MASLLDIVQGNLAKAATQPVGTTDETQRARQLLAAKGGKQVGASQLAPQSAVGEAVANDRTRQQLTELQPAAQIASAEIGQNAAQLAAGEQSARADVALRQQQNQQQNAIRKQQLFGEVEREGRKLDLDRDAARLEQMAHTLRMGDKRYTDMLELEGQRQRLDDDLAFKAALQKSIFGSNEDLLKQQLDNKSILAANDREFSKVLANIDINTALQMASNAAADTRQAANVSAAGSLATAGIGAYAAQQEGKFDIGYHNYKDAGGTGSYSKYLAQETATQNSINNATPVADTDRYNRG